MSHSLFLGAVKSGLSGTSIAVHLYIENTTQALRSSADIDDLMQQIAQRHKAFDQAEQDRKRELQNLYERAITERNDVEEILATARSLRLIFAGTRDSDNVHVLVHQLEMMLADMEKWSALEGSPEDVETIMATDIAQRCDVLEEDDTLDPIWDFREVYTRFKEAAVQSLRDRSAHWMQSVVSEQDVIGSWSLARCDSQLNIVSHPPVFLSVEDKGQLEAVQRMMEERRVYLMEETRRDKAQAWLQAIEAEIAAQAPLAGHACEQFLHTLRRPPEFIQVTEITRVKILEEQLTRRIDELDVSALLERIRQLQPSLRRELLQDLQQAFPEDFAHP